MVRTTVTIGESHFLLAQGQDDDALKRQMESAVQAGGEFVDFVAVGNKTVSALITGYELVLFTTEVVPFDERDTGDVAYPYAGEFFDDGL